MEWDQVTQTPEGALGIGEGTDEWLEFCDLATVSAGKIPVDMVSNRECMNALPIRDLADLARLRDLEPFSTCHRLASLRTGRILSYSEIARDAGLPVTTVRRYLGYLELSYQTFRLNPWAKNPGVRFIKSPKLIWCDLGVQRVLSGQTGGLTGQQYESAIISQLLIHLWTLGIRVTPSFLRTSGGTEVDLLIEGPKGTLAIEIKNRPKVTATDAASIERSRKFMGDAYQTGLVVYRGNEVGQISRSVYAIPDWVLLGT